MLTKTNKEKTKFFTAVFFLLLAVSFLFNLPSAGAAGISGDTKNISSYLREIAISPEVGLGGTPTTIPTMIGRILYGLLGLLGVLCLLLIIYAGVKWMLAEGAEETIAESKAIIKTAIIGVIIIMGSYALTYFVIEKVIESTTIYKTNLGAGGQIQTEVSGDIRTCTSVFDGECMSSCGAGQTYQAGGKCGSGLVCCVSTINRCPVGGYVCKMLNASGQCPNGYTPIAADFKCGDSTSACCPP